MLLLLLLLLLWLFRPAGGYVGGVVEAEGPIGGADICGGRKGRKLLENGAK